MGQMIPINLPADGNWPTIVGDSIMIIGPRQNELTEEQRYFNPIYLMVYPGKEHLKAQMIRAGLCDCDPTKPNRRIGVFSVAPDKQVSFSQGNLQYLPAINLWKFANTQYEYLGNANKYIRPTFRNWVDLFGWSANNTTAPFGVCTSTNAADYAGDFVDWGTNTICGDAPGTWRTLSADEWEYLFEQRKNALQLRSKGSIDGHRGHILLPDDWVLPDGMQFVAEPDNLTMELDINTYTPAEWSIMEEAGAVFLPAAGRRDGTTVGYLVEYSGVWSSTSTTNTNAFHTYYNYDSQIIEHHWTSATSRINGRSVRLVHDTIVPRTIPKRIGVFSVAADKQVSFSQGNLQYVQSTDTWQFAKEQYEYIGAANIKEGKLADKIDLFGWSADNTTAPFGVSTSTNDADYTGEFVDWGTKTICGEAPGTWRTLSADEWEYLLKKRKNASDLYGVAQVAGVNGMIILPDDWDEANGIVFKSGLHSSQVNDYSVYQSFTDAQWLAMENAGAVFLPALGYRDGTNVEKCNTSGYYWSNTTSDEKSAYRLYFYSYFLAPNDVHSKYRGRSVRLVHDTIVPKVEPEPCLVVKVNDTLSINMMCVEGGTFMMGAMEGDTQFYDNEKPAHEVTLTYNYYIAQTEVTQALWKAVMGNNPSTMIGDELPVNNVLWEEANAFVKRLSQMTGYTFHLPTEAEWEFAARGGKNSKGYLYAGSDDVDEVAWYANNSGGKTHAVGTKKPNELGIYDMSGNAWEWCSDWLAPYSAEAQVNPIGPATGEYHVYHGGGWNHGQRYARSSHRRTTTEGYIKSALGLRVAIREKIEPEAVDLGLSVKWANFNVGAFHPTHCGDYFAWGEIEPKETYSWATYKWCDGTQNTMTKYNTTDGKTTLEPADDAAQVHWGGKWRMPTKEEIQELFTRCTWKTETQNGINGYNVIGPNGNSIFVPTAGWYNEDLFGEGVQGNATYYWTSTLYSSNKIHAYDLVFNDVSGSNDGIIANTRRCGFPIRPVYDDRVE